MKQFNVVIEEAKKSDLPQIYTLHYDSTIEIAKDIFQKVLIKNVAYQVAVAVMSTAGTWYFGTNNVFQQCLCFAAIFMLLWMSIYFLFRLDIYHFLYDDLLIFMKYRNFKQAYIAPKQCRFWVAVVKSDTGERTVVGTAGLGFHWSGIVDVLTKDQFDTSIEFKKLVVRQDHRRMGIAKLLTETAIEFALQNSNELGIKSVVLNWYCVSPFMARFYHDLGFEPIGIVDAYGPTRLFSYRLVSALKLISYNSD